MSNHAIGCTGRTVTPVNKLAQEQDAVNVVAGDALREAAVRAAAEEHAEFSMDQLRVISRLVSVPDRAKITSRSELVAEIRARL